MKMKMKIFMVTMFLIVCPGSLVFATEGGNCHYHTIGTWISNEVCECHVHPDLIWGACSADRVRIYRYQCAGGENCCPGDNCLGSAAGPKPVSKIWPCDNDDNGGDDCAPSIGINCVAGDVDINYDTVITACACM